jgi:hypothetical protein
MKDKKIKKLKLKIKQFELFFKKMKTIRPRLLCRFCLIYWKKD